MQQGFYAANRVYSGCIDCGMLLAVALVDESNIASTPVKFAYTTVTLNHIHASGL